jgi:hypothetical protein
MNGLTDHCGDVLFQRGHSQVESLVQIPFRQRNGNRLLLKIPLLEAMLLLRQLEEVRQCARFEFPTDQRDA